MTLSARVEIKGLDRFKRMLDPKTFDRGIQQGLDRIEIRVIEEAKRRVPRKTSRLGRSIVVGPRTPRSRSVLVTANYARAVHEGTRPHVILPRRRKALRFPATAAGARLTGKPRRNAAVIFAKRVQHPGTRAQPFLRDALRAVPAARLLGEALVAVWKRTR